MQDKIYCHQSADARGVVWITPRETMPGCELAWMLKVSDTNRALAAINKKLAKRRDGDHFRCSATHARKIAIQHVADRARLGRYRTLGADERLLLQILIGAFLAMVLVLQLVSAGTVQMIITMACILVGIVAGISIWRARRCSFGS